MPDEAPVIRTTRPAKRPMRGPGSGSPGLRAQNPAQELAGPGPGGPGRPRQLVHGDLVVAELDQLSALGLGQRLPRLERHVGTRGLAPSAIGDPDDADV